MNDFLHDRDASGEDVFPLARQFSSVDEDGCVEYVVHVDPPIEMPPIKNDCGVWDFMEDFP